MSSRNQSSASLFYSMASVYFDAYTGENDIDQVLAEQNQVVAEKRNINQDVIQLKPENQ